MFMDVLGQQSHKMSDYYVVVFQTVISKEHPTIKALFNL